MALALYRKYRPRTFAEIIGQEHVTEPLSQALRTGRLHHAYLFSGPRGCGKTSSARILARSLNCEKGPTPEPCGECASCVALAPDGPGSIDVIEIDAASHGGVDDARDLRERAFFAPVSSRYKIYVIDEAHMVSSAGFNALLKLVEEPPDYVKFVFATTEPEKVLGTIKSRTHHYPFRLIPPGVLRPYLEMLCESEGVHVEPNVFPLVVRAGGGSARDTLSILDQLIAGAGDDGVSYARAVALLGVTDVTLLDEMCDALAAGDGAAVFGAIDRVAEAGHDPRRFAGDLLARLRDLIVMQQVPDAVSKGLLDGSDDELSRMETQAQRFGPATLSRMADVVHTGLIDMRGTTSPRLVLELIAARMLLPGAEASTGALLQRMERMERRLTSSDGGQIQAVVADEAPIRPTSAPGVDSGGREAARAAAQSAARSAAASRSAPERPDPGVRREPATSPDTPPGGSNADPEPHPTAVPKVSAAALTVPATAPRLAEPTQVARPKPAQAAQSAGRPDPAPAPLSAATSSPAAHPSAPEPATASAAEPAGGPKAVGALDADDVRRQWDLVLTYVHHSNKRVAAFVKEAVVRDIDGGTLILLFQHQFHAQALSSDPSAVVDALSEVFGGKWQVRCELAGAAGGTSASGPPPASRSAGSSAPRSRGQGPSRGPAASSGSERPPMPTGDDGWPTAAPIGRDEPPDDDEDGWPAAAQPPATPPMTTATTPPATASMATPPASAPMATPPTRAHAARTAARSSAAAGPAASTAAAPPVATPSRAPNRSTSPPPPEMGFDDGDEPLDDEEEAAAVRQTSEQQAIDLLRETLGAEKIDDLDRR